MTTSSEAMPTANEVMEEKEKELYANGYFYHVDNDIYGEHGYSMHRWIKEGILYATATTKSEATNLAWKHLQETKKYQFEQAIIKRPPVLGIVSDLESDNIALLHRIYELEEELQDAKKLIKILAMQLPVTNPKSEGE